MLRPVALDFILGIVLRGVADMSLVIEVSRVDRDTLPDTRPASEFQRTWSPILNGMVRLSRTAAFMMWKHHALRLVSSAARRPLAQISPPGPSRIIRFLTNGVFFLTLR